MPVLVPGAHADQRQLGPQDPERCPGHGLRAAMMPHLQRVNIHKRASRSERIQHDGFRIPGQQHATRCASSQQHDTRFVLGRLVRSRKRPQRGHTNRTTAYGAARDALPHRRAKPRDLSGQPRGGLGGDQYLPHRNDPDQCLETRIVVVVKVRDHH